MGLLAKLMHKQQPEKAAEKTYAAPYFKGVTEYSPIFSTPNGEVYEQALTRAVIEKFAQFCSKLKPEVVGTAKPRIQRAIKTSPNEFMSWPQMLSRLATVLLNDTTVAIVPSYTERGDINGVFPLKFETCEIVEYEGEAWCRFYVASGDTLAIEYRNVALITRFQYKSDFFGSGNNAMGPTLNLLDYQEQANEQAIKNGSRIQFIGQVTSMVHPEDIERKREKFSEDNLMNNDSGLLLYDQTFNSLQQVEPYSYTVDTDEMGRIEDSVFSYFGINKNILQSDYTEEQFGAYYESQIEPFAVQVGEGLTRMLYTQRERANGNQITFSANRLEYASNASKRNMVRDMLDRRVMTVNEAREILQLPPVPGGNIFIERGEYVTFDLEGNVLTATAGKLPDQMQEPPRLKNTSFNQGNSYAETDFDLGGDDDIYNDVDSKGALEQDAN